MQKRSTNFISPILEYTPEGLVSCNGDVTVCFALTKPVVFTLPTGQLESLHQAVGKAIRCLPYGTIVHFQDLYMRLPWLTPTRPTPPPFLEQASDHHFHGRPYLQHLSYCFITLRAPGRRASPAGLSLLQPSLFPAAVRRPERLRPFLDKTRQFQRHLTDSGLMQVRPLSLAEMESREIPGIVENYCQLPTGNEPVLGDIAFRDGLRIGPHYCSLHSLADAEQLPDQCSPFIRYEPYSTAATLYPVGFASSLGPLLDADHIFNLFIFLDDPQKTLAEMETRRRRLKSLSGQSRENAITSETIARFQEEAAAGQRLPVKVHANVMVWADTREALREIDLQVHSAMNRMGVVPHLETVSAPDIWWAGIPGNAAALPTNETFDTFVEQAVCFLPLEASAPPGGSGFGMRLGDRQTGCPQLVDTSDKPMRNGWISNRNKFVVGPSGSGKSVLLNHFTRSYHEQSAHILILDIGGSYKTLCELLGGLYFTYSEKEPICLNPFRLDEGDYPDTEKKESIKTLLLALWKKSDEAFLRSEYVALSNALQGYYQYLTERRELAACFNSWYEYLRDVYAPLLAGEKVKEKDFDIENFLFVLRPFYKGGEYDFLLNALNQPSLLHERLIVFDLDSIKDHPILISAVTIMIMELFISKMRTLKGVRKVIIIEEAWKALANAGMSEFLRYLFKTIRKYFGEAIVATQDVDDILSNPVVRNAILNNADTRILLDMSKFLHRLHELQEPLGLREDDKAKLLSVNKANDPAHKYKEVFIGFANGPSQVYRTELSLEEYLTYTTEESEKVLVNKYGSVHGGIRKGLAALAADIRAGVVQLLLAVAFSMVFLLIPQGKTNAQVLEVVEIVNAAVKKVIVEADIQVQRLQTQTLVLQNAEKALENSMAGGLLDDITDWVQQQENLYGEYYQELWKVKSALSTYTKVATLIQRQAQLVTDEQQAWSTVQHDPHFSVSEISSISSVYSGILSESERNAQQIATVINAFVTQMDDAGRLRIIDETDKAIDHNDRELREFTQENILLSLQRAKDENDLLTIKALYNL